MSALFPWQWPSKDLDTIPNLFLGATSLIALADLSTIAERVALTGGASYLDIFTLCPGIHRQEAAAELNKGEYVFRGDILVRLSNDALFVLLSTSK